MNPKLKRLFEMMEKINHDFHINEEKPIDVKTMKNVMKGSYVELQKNKIDSVDEFKPAFKVWFQTLGFDPESNKINPNRVRHEVFEVLKELGY